MSKKRTSTEASNEEDKTKVVAQHEDNTKRAKLITLSDTTLQDLPIELLEYILIKAVTMEVKGMRLAKSLWKEKADLVISRLRTVSLQWSSILTSDFFRNELHKTLDGYAQETIRMEILLEPTIQSYIRKLTSMGDEVFMLCEQHRGGSYVLNVYNRSNVIQSKAVIPISEFDVGDMAACSVSNCVYLLNTCGPSVLRITKDEHQFKTEQWIKKLKLPTSDMYLISVSANGNLIIVSRHQFPAPTVVGIILLYDANGLLQLKMTLNPAVGSYVSSAIQNSNGNRVLASSNNSFEANLLEIDMSGRIIRKYQSSYRGVLAESFVDIHGRILTQFTDGRIELLDSELNFLDSAVPRLDDGSLLSPYGLHFNSERHELVGVRYNGNSKSGDLVTFRFTEP